jgi:hypothetical protein
MNPSMRWTYIAAAGLPLALLLTRPALASAVYPEHIAQVLETPCVPSCSLCHKTNKGGPGDINGLFGTAATDGAGLKGGSDIASLDAALAALAMKGSNVDGDMDGGDIDELRAGTDPNVAGADLCTGPKYGCGASSIAKAPHNKAMDPAATVAGALSVVIGLLLARRRR